MSAREKVQNEKLDQNSTLLKCSIRPQVLAKLKRKIRKLSPEMRAQITAEFNKLVELGFFVAVHNLPEEELQELRDSKVLFF